MHAPKLSAFLPIVPGGSFKAATYFLRGVRPDPSLYPLTPLTPLDVACSHEACATDGKRCKPAPGRSHGSPLATRATAPEAFIAFLACTQPRALCIQARVSYRQRIVHGIITITIQRSTTQARQRNPIHPHCTPPPARPQTHRSLLTVVAGAQTYGRHCVHELLCPHELAVGASPMAVGAQLGGSG